MTRKFRALAVTMVALGLCGSCADSPRSAAPDESAQREAVLMPHKSWTCGMAEGIPKPENGVLVFEADMKLDQIYDVGQTPYGRRQVLVVQGGTVQGEKFQGIVLAGGLDFQLTLSNGVMEIEQVMMLRSADGRYIYMRNAGTGVTGEDVRMVFDIEAPNASTSAWLNSGKYVGRRSVDAAARTMKLTVYDVAAIAARPHSAGILTISKPADVPEQPWDCRRAGPAEKNGDPLVTENVTLAASQSVGASKRGNRNVIPITGGTLTGVISGKVLPGGADYQNPTQGPAIDARYLWQSAEGEIIIVRNTGPFGSLVPLFETRSDGKYAWLNKGTFLSSNPGVGAGGVSLTMYRSTH